MSTLLAAQYLPRRPHASNDLTHGVRIVSRSDALSGMKFIESSPKTLKNVMVFDIDAEQAERKIKSLAWDDEIIPEPNLIVVNPISSHAHAMYFLDAPVGTTRGLEFFKDVRTGLNSLIGGDAAFAGRMMRSPMAHPHEEITDHLYTLQELNTPEVKEAKKKAQQARQVRLEEGVASGRNDYLFESLRSFAYSTIRQVGYNQAEFSLAVELKALEINELNFDQKLPYSEVKATVKSVTRWVLTHFSKAQFSAIQAARSAKRWGDSKAERALIALEMRAGGASWAEMGQVLGCTAGAARTIFYRAQKLV